MNDYLFTDNTDDINNVDDTNDTNDTDNVDDTNDIETIDDTNDTNDTIDDTNDDLKTLDALTNELHKCYQIQVDDDGICKPVLMGKYREIPLPINKKIKYKKYILYVVTYILTQEEIDKKIYKIIGVNLIRRNRKKSICSLDLTFNVNLNRLELLFCDHKKEPNDPEAVRTIEILTKFPKKDKVVEYIIEKAFDEPIKSILLRRR